MAPLGQNHHTFPQGKHEFLGMDSGEDDAQAGEELYQQYQNGSGFYPATARYDEVAENKLTSALLPALKNQLSVCQQTVEDAYANDGIYGNTSAETDLFRSPGLFAELKRRLKPTPVQV